MRLHWISALLAASWLYPFANGPSPAIMPWLACLFIVAGLLLLVRCGEPATALKLAFGGMAAIAMLRSGPGELALVATPVMLGVGFACAGIGVAAMQNERLLRAIAVGWLAAALLSSVIGLCQYFGIEQFFAPWMNQGIHDQVYANLRQRNQFATLTSIGLAALVWLAGQRLTGPHAWWMLALLALGNATSASHTGTAQWLALVVLVGVWRIHVPKEARLLVWGALPFYIIATLALPLLSDVHFTALSRLDAHDQTCSGRRFLWANVLDLIGQRPWSGWGWHNLAWAHYMGTFKARFCDIPDNAHDLPLQLAVELGLPAAAAFCLLVLGMVWRAKPWREHDTRRILAWSVVAVIVLHSLVEYPLWYGPFQMACGLALGMLWPARAGFTSPKSPPSVWQAGVALALLAGAAWASWDYHRVSQLFLQPEQREARYAQDTLDKVRDSWLFANEVRFAEIATTPVTPQNAQRLYDAATILLHYSPEPRVIEQLIAASRLTGRTTEAEFHESHYKAAFPADYDKWKANGPG